MLCTMSTSTPIDMDDADDNVIDISPPNRKRRRKLIWIIVAALALIFILFRSVSIYVSALWFGSLGYSSVYWYIFKAKLILFFGFAILTALLLATTFLIFQRL